MRATWDALARADSDVFVGDPTRAADELAALFGRLGADPRAGLCIEVGCGPGRMTAALAERFDRVLALDVSPKMIAKARSVVTRDNVSFMLISGANLKPLDDGIADALVCYLVLQHLPRRALVGRYLHEFARVLKRGGEAFVQLPVLDGALAARVWRAARTTVVPVLYAVSRNPAHAPALRGVRLTARELDRALGNAGLVVRAREEGPDAPYRFSRDVFLRLARQA
jgi:SAM-dependent methyltransferase